MRLRALGPLFFGLMLPGFSPVAAATVPTDLSSEIDASIDDVEASLPAVGHGGGLFVIAWRTHAAGGDAIQARIAQHIGSSTTFKPPFTVKAAVAGVSLSGPGVAMDAAGLLTIVWGEARATESCV